MNQTARIILGCFVFVLIVAKIFAVVHHNAGRLVPTIVVPDPGNNTRDTIWTPDYRKQVADVLYRQADTLLVLPNQRREFAGCLVIRFKRLFPKGLAAVSQDSLDLLARRAYGSCLNSLSDTALLRWTPYQQQVLRRGLYAKTDASSLPKDTRTHYCDCIVDALQARYARGIKGRMDTRVVKSTGDSCAAKILR